jgi:hypothetical protein
MMSNTPVLPLILDEGNYGKNFLLALEKTALLTRWFDCRILLSRLPTPVLNLADEYFGTDDARRKGEPVALLVENVPSSMNWLLPEQTLARSDIIRLCRTFGDLHAIVRELAVDSDVYAIVYDLVTAASEDALTLYHEADRLIEKKSCAASGGRRGTSSD